MSAADFDGDGDVDAADNTAYSNANTAGDPSADLNLDSVVDFNDTLAWNNLYNAGETGGRSVLSRSSVRNRIGYAGYQHDPSITGSAQSSGQGRYWTHIALYDATLGRLTVRRKNNAPSQPLVDLMSGRRCEPWGKSVGDTNVPYQCIRARPINLDRGSFRSHIIQGHAAPERRPWVLRHSWKVEATDDNIKIRNVASGAKWNEQGAAPVYAESFAELNANIPIECVREERDPGPPPLYRFIPDLGSHSLSRNVQAGYAESAISPIQTSWTNPNDPFPILSVRFTLAAAFAPTVPQTGTNVTAGIVLGNKLIRFQTQGGISVTYSPDVLLSNDVDFLLKWQCECCAYRYRPIGSQEWRTVDNCGALSGVSPDPSTSNPVP
jgi:hypothetical protein